MEGDTDTQGGPLDSDLAQMLWGEQKGLRAGGLNSASTLEILEEVFYKCSHLCLTPKILIPLAGSLEVKFLESAQVMAEHSQVSIPLEGCPAMPQCLSLSSQTKI